MRLSQLQRPQARGNESIKPKEKPGTASLAEDRVKAFLLELGATPIVSQAVKTKKIHYSPKNHTNAHPESNKENRHTLNTNSNTKRTDRPESQRIMARTATNKLSKTSQKNSNSQLSTTCTRQQKTAKPRSQHQSNGRNVNRNPKVNRIHRSKAHNALKSKSSSRNNSMALVSRTEHDAIDEFAIQLQIKSTECEMFKTQIQELKKENELLQREKHELQAHNEKLKVLESEHNENKQEMLRYHEKLKQQSDRILKLEHKLESCGVDPIALQSPQFMSEDTQKSIIFWRERLFKARQKLNERKRRQQSILQIANSWIQRLDRA